jgi:hypothetical protein
VVDHEVSETSKPRIWSVFAGLARLRVSKGMKNQTPIFTRRGTKKASKQAALRHML